MTRRIVCAANKCVSNHQIILGIRHYDLFMRTHGARYLGLEMVQGFVDQHGVFLTRTEAWPIAEAAGQIIRRVGGDETDGGTLYSENLY